MKYLAIMCAVILSASFSFGKLSGSSDIDLIEVLKENPKVATSECWRLINEDDFSLCLKNLLAAKETPVQEFVEQENGEIETSVL